MRFYDSLPHSGAPQRFAPATVPKTSWARAQEIARGFFEVIRLAERERRRDAGEPLLQLAGRECPAGRPTSSSTAAIVAWALAGGGHEGAS